MTTPASAIEQSLRPVAVDERIDLVDVVRGFALYGVLLANLVWITTDVVLTESHMAALPTAALDRIVKPLIVFFVDGKFYTLFSFLFGLGFAIQLSRAEQRGRGIAMTYARRIAILALIGLAHIVFVWYGDILLVYATGGLALLLVKHWNSRLLLILAIGLALSARLVVGLYPVLTGAPRAAPVNSALHDDVEKDRKLAVFDGPSYSAIASENRSFYYGEIVSGGVWLFLLPQVFARFLLGLYVGRRNWAQRTAELVPSLRRVLPWSIAIAVIGNGAALVIDRLQHDGVIGPDSYWMHLRAPVWEAGVLAMAFVYLAILVFLFHSGSAWRGRLGYLAPVGRMALTNYLTHSVLYLALFTGVGLGLYGEVGPALCVVLSMAIFTAQMAFSRWWLARYRFGPAEWVWRTLTYGQGQPMTLIGK
jgi:uncharacterized protein